MHPKQIPVKTLKGSQEIQNRTHQLPAHARQILIMVDGRSTVRELIKKLVGFGPIQNILDQLEINGFIAPQPGSFQLEETSRRLTTELSRRPDTELSKRPTPEPSKRPESETSRRFLPELSKRLLPELSKRLLPELSRRPESESSKRLQPELSRRPDTEWSRKPDTELSRRPIPEPEPSKPLEPELSKRLLQELPRHPNTTSPPLPATEISRRLKSGIDTWLVDELAKRSPTTASKRLIPETSQPPLLKVSQPSLPEIPQSPIPTSNSLQTEFNLAVTKRFICHILFGAMGSMAESQINRIEATTSPYELGLELETIHQILPNALSKEQAQRVWDRLESIVTAINGLPS